MRVRERLKEPNEGARSATERNGAQQRSQAANGCRRIGTSVRRAEVSAGGIRS